MGPLETVVVFPPEVLVRSLVETAKPAIVPEVIEPDTDKTPVEMFIVSPLPTLIKPATVSVA